MKGFSWCSSRIPQDVMVNESYKPVLNLLGRGKHGVSSVDYITMWFFCLKMNVTTLPGLAI
jgi:hypothetical protein